MPAPTNISFATAIDLGSIYPISTTQEQSFGGTTYNTYYLFTIPAGVTEVGPFIYGNFGTWNPVMTLWRDPLGMPVQINGSISGNSVPEQALVIPGEVIGLISSKQIGNPSPALTTISIELAPTTALANGNIVQNDVSPDFPAAIVSINNEEVSNFTSVAFAWSDYGRILTSGVSLFSDATANAPILYDKDLNAILTVAGLTAANDYIIGTDQTTGFWAVARKVVGSSIAQFVSPLGVVTGITYDLGAASTVMKTVTPSLDNTILYFIQNTSNVNYPVQKIVLGSLTITTFIAGEIDKIWSPGMMTMLDDTILIGISSITGITLFDNFVRRYDDTAVLINTYNIGDDWRVIYIFAALDDPISFWVYAQPTVAFPDPVFFMNRYINIRASDGTFLHDIQIPQFIDGVSQEPGSISSVRFGTSYGGAPMIARSVTPPGSGAGLYVLTGTGNPASGVNPVLRHDNLWIDTSIGTTTDIAIANPYAEGYLAGDE